MSTSVVYAGIGSRRTPGEIAAAMDALAYRLADRGWLLRTGGAAGADQAFLAGALQGGGEVELYLPWPDFERDALARWGAPSLKLQRPDQRAYPLAEAAHPAWERLSRGGRSLQARNVHQVLGPTLDRPVNVVICWTPCGSLDGLPGNSGGTGQALRLIARHAPQARVFNLARAEHLQRIRRYLEQVPA
jgi:hypothetical protein